MTKVYILDSYGRLFLSTFYADPSYNSTVTTYYYKVDNIESFSSLMIPLSNDGTVTENYTIFKTSDGTYYTDYNSGIEDIKILKINNIEPEVENTNES